MSTDAGSFLTKQHQSIVTVLKKLGIKEVYLNITKTIYRTPVDNVILNKGKLKNISSTIRNKKMQCLKSYS